MKTSLSVAVSLSILLITWGFWRSDALLSSAASNSTNVAALPKRIDVDADQREPSHAAQNKVKALPSSIIESRRKRDDFMQRESEMWPEAVKDSVVSATVKRVEAALHPILASWRTDPTTNQKVLEIMHNLEADSMDIYVAHLKYGMKGQPAKRKAQESEEAVANFQLESLVGADRAGVILKTRSEVLNMMSIEGINRANTRNAAK
jgi:hypothetical protein